jgi:cobalt-zinc-cadmium efflux system membrane fusion protein
VKKILTLTCGLLAVGSIVGWQLTRESSNGEESHHHDEHDHAHHHHDHDHDHDHEHEEETVVHISLEQIKKVGIEIEQAKAGDLMVSIVTRGKAIIHPDGLAHIVPKISGVAKEARKNIGDKVKEGEEIAVLESREMADIRSNYLAVIEKEKLARSLYEREQNLYGKKISSEQEYLNAKSAHQETKINLKLAKQKLSAFGLPEQEITAFLAQKDPDLSTYTIRSPIDGTIMNRHITKGEYIEDVSMIYEVADLNRIWVEVGIFPKDLNSVKVGQTVKITSADDPNTTTHAKIIYVSPIIQEETITAKAIAEVDNSSGKWRPGSFVKINIATELIPVKIIAPKTAIQEIEGETYVFVKIPEGFEKRAVELGRTDNDSVEIVAGLDAGEYYASTETFLLKADLGKGEAEHEH